MNNERLKERVIIAKANRIFDDCQQIQLKITIYSLTLTIIYDNK